MTAYDDYQLGYAAPVLRGANGEAWHTAMGVVKNALYDEAVFALKCRFLTTCPLDALQYIGHERAIEQFNGEDLEAYRTRLLGAWDAWTYAGTKTGILNAIAQLGYVNVTLEENADGTMPPSPGFSAGDEWWRFRVIIGTPNNLTTTWTIGDGTTVGSGKVVGNTITGAAIAQLLQVIKKWKPPHAVLVNLIVMIGGKAVGSFTVGDGTLVGGTAIYAA